MNIRLLLNNISDAFDELVGGSRSRRLEVRSAKYYSNIKYVELLSIVSDNKIGVVLDVGANEGQFAEYIRGIGYKGEIVSFEPFEEAFSILKQKADKEGSWIVWQCALGARGQTQKFNAYGDSKLNSFLQGDGSQVERFSTKFNASKVVEIEVKRLDDLWEQVVGKGNEDVFLKMDTQGYDLEVFRGLGDKKKYVKYVLMELSVIPIYKEIASYLEALKEMEEAGFGPVAFIPVTRNKADLRVIELDCILKRLGD